MTKQELIIAIVALDADHSQNVLIKSSKAQLAKILADLQDTNNDVPAEKVDVVDSLRQASQLEDEKSNLYEGILVFLSAHGVLWDAVSDHLREQYLQRTEQNGVTTEWPTKLVKSTQTQKDVGIGAACKAGHYGAIWLNRFNVYRSKYSNYNMLREAAPVAPTAPASKTAPAASGLPTATEQNKADKTTSTGNVFSKDALPLAFAYMLKQIEVTAKDEAEKECISDALSDLAAFFKIKLA